ncbi:sensor histidine kinase [Microbispora sp. H10670]|uniref:sensor histidine kinase n=1 Tax=Microbispora sp. H10670 TaxID=2729108 RepID=UPI0028730D4F|nr:histidine kinase [Microbispora sp. H10670]
MRIGEGDAEPGIRLAALRRILIDSGFALLTAGASILVGSDVFLTSGAHDKLLQAFGSAAGWHTHVTVWWLATSALIVALFLRHRWPWAAILLAAAGAAAHQADPFMDVLPVDFAVLVVLYTMVATTRSRRIGMITLGGLLTALYGVHLLVRAGFGLGTEAWQGTPAKSLLGSSWQESGALTAAAAAVVPALLLVVAWAVGDNVRTRRAHLAVLTQRAADLERERDQRAALAVAAERGRITRELHDVVAHGLSVMVVQAQGGQAAIARRPERAEKALAEIVTTGRAALAEMRRLLGLVRAGTGPDLAPQPRLAALPGLIDGVRDSGTPVEFVITGEAMPLPAAVELSAYRIVQEALTNTIKHAGPGARARVRLDFSLDALTIDIRDTGGTAQCSIPADDRPQAADSRGNGLRGIAERVAALGGTLTGGPCDDGFKITAALPLEHT